MAGPADERAELERLRKLKRLRELEAKAAGQAPAIPAPSTPDPNRFPPQPGLEGPAVNQNILPGMGGGQMGAPSRAGYGGATGATVSPPSVSQMQSFQLGTEKGASFGFRDEAEGLRSQFNALRPVGALGPLTDMVGGAIGAGMEAFGVEPERYQQSRDFRRMLESGAQKANPVSFMAGEVVGNIAVPVGASATAPTKVAQVARGAGTGAAAAGLYGFAASEGDIGQRATDAAIYGTTGGVLGGALSSVIPRDIPLGQVLNAELFGASVERPVLKTIERMLVDAGVSPDDIATGVIQIRQRLQGGDVGTGLPTRFKDELVKQFGEKARGVSEAIETQIRGGAARSGSASDAAVRAMVSEDNAAARELFDRSLDQFAGSLSRPELRGQALDQLGTIIEERYKPILAAGIADPAKRQALLDVLSTPRMQSLAKELAEDAEREGIDLAALMARNPAEAGHWMQSKARQLADDRGKVTITGRTVPDRTMSNRRKDILDALEDAVPGYRETRMEYGDKHGVLEAMNFAQGFLSRSKNDVAVADMAEEFASMSEAQQQMALASLRSLLSGSAGNIRYVDPDLGTGALRTAEIGKEPVLKALSEVFGGRGTALADDIKAIVTRFDSNRRINPQGTGSDTVPKAEAIKKAISNTRGPIQNALASVFGGAPVDIGLSALTGGPTPVMAARAGIQGAGKVADTRAMSTVDKVTELLLARPQNALSAAPPTPSRSGAGGASGSIIEQLPPPAPSPNALAPDAPPIRAGGLVARGDVSSALAYGGVGGFSGNFMDYNQDGVKDAQDMAIGAGIGATGAVGLNRAGRMLPKSQAERLAATQDIPQAAAVMAEKFKPRKITRGATDADWEEASKEAFDLLKAQAAKQDGFEPGARVWNEKAPESLTDPNAPPRFVYEDLAAQILRSRGIDPDPVYGRMLSERPSNAETERMGKLIGYEAGNARAAARAAELDEADPWEGTLNYLDDLSSDKTRLNSFAPGSDMMNALAGAGLGGIAPADSAEERARNMAIGAGLGGGARRVGKAFGSEADGAVRSAGAGGKRPPKPDSPEAIKAALKDMAKDQKEPTRLERMVDDGRDAAVPPANPTPHPDDKVAQQAQRMLDRGMSPIEVYDKTRIAFVPYNGGNVPVLSPSIGPEELTRKFYAWMARPPRERPEWVRHIMRSAPPKKGMMLTDRAPAPPRQNALVEPPVDDSIPWGGIGVGAGAGLLTGVPAGILAGTAYARNQDRKRNALAE